MIIFSTLAKASMDASMQVDYYVQSSMTGLQTVVDLDVRRRLTPRLQYLLLNRHKICIELGYVSYLYHGPAQQHLAGSVWHVLDRFQHVCHNIQRITTKLQLLAEEANKLHIAVLEAALNGQVAPSTMRQAAVANNVGSLTRKRPVTRSQTSTQPRKRARLTKG